MEYLIAAVVVFFVVAFVVGTLWSRTDSYKANQRFKRAQHNAKRGVSPIVED